MLWYARAPRLTHGRERILPNGCAQIILNLARDFIFDCPEHLPMHPMAPSLVVGARSVYEIVDTTDMADLAGILFHPGGLPAFMADSAHLFSNRTVDLEDVWGGSARGLRDRLREVAEPRERMRVLEAFLTARCKRVLAQRRPTMHDAVRFALQQFDRAPSVASVRDVAGRTGWSERRLSQLFREQVGFSPKVWCRIRRFQRTVQQLHAGSSVAWPELALECGFYDQSHFANEFKAFSGIDATTYSKHGTLWANHVRVE